MASTHRVLSNIRSLYQARWNSLRWRLLALLGGMFLITLLGIGTSVFYFIFQNEQRFWRERQAEAAWQASETVTGFIQRVEDTLHVVGSLEKSDLLANPRLLDRMLRQNPAFLELIRLDPAGHIFAWAYQDEPLLANLFTIPQSRWFIQSKAGNLYLGEVQISAASEPYIVMSFPAADGGVVAGRVRMNMLREVVEQLRFGQTGQAYVSDQLGQIIAHSNPEVELYRTNLAGRPEMAAIPAAPQQIWSRTYQNFQGIDTLGVVQPVAGTGWLIFTEVAQAEAFAMSRTAFLLLSGGLALFGLLIMGVTGRFLDTLILGPIEQLRAGAQRIGQGDLSHRIELPRQDEVGQVAGAFNEMARQLELRETQVVDRTQALAASEERFRQMAAAISDHIYRTELGNQDKPVNHYLSPNIESLTGYPPEKFLADWSFWPTTVIHADDRAAAAEQAARLAQGQASEMEYRLVRADGSVIWVRDSGRVEPNNQGGLTVYGVVSDITARKQAEVLLTRALEEAQAASQLKSELLAKVNHELRTPLGSILGFSEMLLEGLYGPLPVDQQEPLNHIIDSTQYLSHRVNDLLDQAQLEAGKLKLQIRPFNPRIFIDDVMAKMQVLAQPKGLHLSAGIAPTVPANLWGDVDRLKQILINLVGNAIKFTEQGEVKIMLSRPDPIHWAMEVSDTGAGIPVEAQAVIFEPFRQVDSSVTRQQAGTGLGLAIVKQLVSLMGGQINVVSKVGTGSTFIVVLPLESIQKVGVT